MARRIRSAAVGILFVVAVFFLTDYFPFVINLLFACVCVWAICEIFAAMDIFRIYPVVAVTLAYAAAQPLLCGTGFEELAFYVYSLLLFIIMIFVHKKIAFKDIAVVYSMVVLITASLSRAIAMYQADPENGLYYVVVCLGIPWFADGGAYFAGSFWGKHKLCPDISPKKTIEGVFGGLVCGVAMMMAVNFVFEQWLFVGDVHANYLNMALLALIGSAISVFGDLCFSLVKRGCHIKDFGNVLPGHGGVLDRFDSVIFVVPVIYLFIQYLPLVGA